MVQSEDAVEKGKRLALGTRRDVGARHHGAKRVQDGGDAEIIG